MINIVSDGTAFGIKVYGENGTKISGITRNELIPIVPHGLVSARLTFAAVKLDMVADDGAVPSTNGVSCTHNAVPDAEQDN